MKYYRHPRLYMTDNDKKWGFKKRGMRKQHILNKLKIDLETKSQKKKRKPQQTYGVFCCGCR